MRKAGLSLPILTTKLHIPKPSQGIVARTKLIKKLNQGLHKKMTLISAPAGFGKTTLISQWITDCRQPTAWLSLDQSENEPVSFLLYLTAALQTVFSHIGQTVMSTLLSPGPLPSIKSVFTILLNEITAELEANKAADLQNGGNQLLFVLDDYHVINCPAVGEIVTFWLNHMPLPMHLVLATRQDPDLPLPRLRAGAQLTQLRAADLRFTTSEINDFFRGLMNLKLSRENIAALEKRTEGWIAGLQLAALSMQGLKDYTLFIDSFTGSHYFIMDYLVQEVLQQQPEQIQIFLLQTSILERFCAPLCDTVLQDSSASSQRILESIEKKNLFIVPLDNEHCWYRYHHLFADLLRQRLKQFISSNGNNGVDPEQLHRRASAWYENNNLVNEAFQHAVAAHAIDRALHLIEEDKMPLYFMSGINSILAWLDSLPIKVLEQRPLLRIKQASLLLISGQTSGIEKRLQAAEKALNNRAADEKTRDMLGRIAAIRSTLALSQYQFDTIIEQAKLALHYLHPDSLLMRNSAVWTLANAYELQGDRISAAKIYQKSLSMSKETGNQFFIILSKLGLANMQELENRLHQAARAYQNVIRLFSDQLQPVAGDAYLGLARIYYQWNDLDQAQQYAEKSLQLARLYDEKLDRYIICELFLARLKLARADINGAERILTQTSQSVQANNFKHRQSEAAALQVLILLHEGDLESAERLSVTNELPICQVRVQIARGDTLSALQGLEKYDQKAVSRCWQDEKLKIRLLQALALSQQGDKDRALEKLRQALVMAEPAGFIRLFVDEGLSMAQLLREAGLRKIRPDYIRQLLTAFADDKQKQISCSPGSGTVRRQLPQADENTGQLLIVPLSERELQVLQLIARGMSNQEIGNHLFLALDTVKGHNRNIFNKLQVKRRTEAVARALDLGLL